MRRTLFISIVTAVAYFAAGRLALMLAIPPGYASGVWPAAGIALVLVLVFGLRAAPGVFLGNLLVNLPTGGVVLPIGIAAGAMLQAVVGAAGVRRFVGYPNALEEERAVGAFLLIAGPVACLVSATVGSTSLLLAGKIVGPEYFSNWLTWWIGDVVGAVVFAPLTLIVIGAPRDAWRSRARALGGPLLAVFGLIVGLHVRESRLLHDRLSRTVESESADLERALRSAIERDVATLRGMTGLFYASEMVGRGEFERYADLFLTSDRIQALEWAPLVSHADRAAFVAAARRDGLAGYELTEADGERLVPAAPRDEYVPVRFVRPLDENRSALGFDLRSDEVRRSAMERAARSGDVAATAPIRLVQESGEQSGCLLMMAVYDDLDVVAQRRPRGYVLAVYRVGDLVDSAVVGLSQGDHVSITLTDVTDPSRPHTLREPGGRASPAVAQSVAQSVAVSRSFPVGGRVWAADFVPKAPYLAEMRAEAGLVTLLGGCSFAALLGALLLLITGRASRVARLVRDRTDELRTKNERLAALSARMRAFLDCSQSFVMLSMDLSGRVVLFNSGAERMLGYTADEMSAGKSCVDLHVQDELETRARELSDETGQAVDLVQALTKVPLEQGHETRKWTYVRSDGSTFPVEATLVPLRADGELLGFFGVAVDITERRRAEDAMEQARDEAVRLAQTKSDFLANMSHEIRTPMNGVVGMAQLLECTELDTQQKDYVRTLRKSSDALLAVITDILDFSKLESGKLDVEAIGFDVHKLTRDTAGIVAAEARAKGLALDVEIGENVPRCVTGDPARLRQVLLNLLGNAVKFTEHGAIAVRVTTVEGGARLQFEVIDDGIGIEPHALSHIFGAFSQEDASVTRRFGGTGLGLAITDRLVRLLGGQVRVESEKGSGSRFWFSLPVGPTPTTPPPDTMQIPQAPTELAGASPRVLVAEDNHINQRVILRMLERAGCQVTIVADGEAAVSAWRAGEYDAIFMDCQMPKLDGYSATRRIRQLEPAGVRVPIIAATAHAMDGDRDRALGAGMDDYIAKPFRVEAIHELIEKWVPSGSAAS